MSDVNPFDVAAAVGAARKALAEIDARTRALSAGAHLDACQTIMMHAVLRRVELAREAAAKWYPDVKASGVFITQTHTGVIHLRVRMEILTAAQRSAFIEFIGSPKSNVIACEGHNGIGRKRWPKIAMTAEGISEHVDRALEDFLASHH